MKMAETACFRSQVPPSRHPDAHELRKLSEELNPNRGTFLFAHARLAWLESHGEAGLP